MIQQKIEKLPIDYAIKEIKRHRLEDQDFWKALPNMDEFEALKRATTLLARCMTERSMLLRLMGHLAQRDDGEPVVE